MAFPFSKSKFDYFYRTCARDLRATVAICCIVPCSRKHAANRSNSRALFRPMWRDRSRDYRKLTNTELMIFFTSHSPALKISTVSKNTNPSANPLWLVFLLSNLWIFVSSFVTHSSSQNQPLSAFVKGCQHILLARLIHIACSFTAAEAVKRICG